MSEAEELADYEVKPNFRVLGPRFGSRMPEVAKAIAALDPAEVAGCARPRRERRRSRSTASEESLGAEDLSLVMLPRGGLPARAPGELRGRAEGSTSTTSCCREGVAREVVHAIQNARKGAGLQVEDRIELTLFGDDALLDAVREHADYVAGETLAASLDVRRRAGRGAAHRDAPASTAQSSGSRCGAPARPG